MKVLLIIDVQNDFCPNGALAVKDGDKIIPSINLMMDSFDLTLATQDWHPPGHGSFASSHFKNVGEVIELEGIKQILWPDHCVQNTEGARLNENLDLNKIAKIFKKGIHQNIDSYSGFFENDHLTATTLGPYLKSINLTDLTIVGLATDYCVKYTALDAIKMGFNTTVLVNACRGVELNSGDVKKAIEEMFTAGVNISSKEFN